MKQTKVQTTWEVWLWRKEEIGAVVGEKYWTDEDFSFLMAETLCKTDEKVKLMGTGEMC